MQQNQRARLVLKPIGLLLVLLVLGLGAGIGISLHDRKPEKDSTANPATHSVPSSSGIVLSSDRLDFGDITPDHSVTRQLLVRNTGSRSVQLRLEDPSGGFVVSPSSLTVESGSIARVTVTAGPRQPGSFRQELRVYSEAGSKNPLVVFLEGNARETSAMAADRGEVEPTAAPEGAVGAGEHARRTESGSTPRVDLARTSPDDAASAASPGSVRIERSSSPGAEGSAVDARSPGVVVVPPRSISERPSASSSGDEPAPLNGNRKKPADLEKKPEDPPTTPGAPFLTVSAESSLSVFGSKGRLSPQKVGVLGSASGGSFTLASGIQFPSISIGFGQSLMFTQTGAAVGSFDPSSGQVTLVVPLDAVDPNGNAAPMIMEMTTGAVVARNNNGVLVSLAGQPRTPDSGLLHLVSMKQIPTGHRNSAEQQFVFLEIWASLTFPRADAGASGGAN